jgi:hypothetical protein
MPPPSSTSTDLANHIFDHQLRPLVGGTASIQDEPFERQIRRILRRALLRRLPHGE